MRLFDSALSAGQIALLAAAQPEAISETDMLDSLTADERLEQASSKAGLARAQDELKDLNKAPGLTSEWADLAQGLATVFARV